MKLFHSDEREFFVKFGFSNYILATLTATALLLTHISFGQEDDEDDDEDSDHEETMEEVVATGSRLTNNLVEIAGQVIVLTEEEIRATGEVTLERVLRQLPENLNPTTERFGSTLNNVANFDASSTVNLRGLGSESTLILVDGKRIGHSGFLGGVTDVSQIPLSQVERIEIILDGASAIYGSDAVGGVINVITRKDYEGLELTMDYDTPSDGTFDEWRLGVVASTVFSGIRARANYQRSTHSGLDASDREVTLFQQSLFSGPSYDVRFCCLADGTSLPIAYSLNGDVLTLAEYNALSDAQKAQATAYTHAILPDGFNQDSSIDDITNWSVPSWGAATQDGWNILPDVTRDSYNLGAATELPNGFTVEAVIRGEMREVISRRGYISFSGETLTGGSPFNPFGRSIHLRGQRRDYPQPFTATEAERLSIDFSVSGDITETIDFEVSMGRSRDESDTSRHFDINRTGLRAGMNSDGVTLRTQFLSGETAASCAEKGGTFSFGLCRVRVPPPPAVNPFGDISEFISETPLLASSLNEHTRYEGLVRVRLFNLPAGNVRALIGGNWSETVLNSWSEFQVGAVDSSPISDLAEFHTKTSRSNHAVYAEGLIPLISSFNEMPFAQALTLSISLRNDTYVEPSVTFVTDEGNTSASGLPDPGSETTWGLGLVWEPQDFLQVKLNHQTAFVAPQLNQLLRDVSEGPSPPFRGIFIQLPNGNLLQRQITIIEGGNPELLSETADTQSVGVRIIPPVIPGLEFLVTYSDVEYMNRINRLSNFIVDPENLPRDTRYVQELDTYIQERRWINVSSIDRSGFDYGIRWNTETEMGMFRLNLRHAVIDSYNYVVDPTDPTSDENVSVVGSASASTAVGVVSKHSTNFNMGWSHRGLDLGIDISTRSKTTRLFTGVRREYTPPIHTDITFSFDVVRGGLFALPDMFEDTRMSLYINNVFDEFGETSVVSSSGEELQQTSPDSSALYGRVINFSVRMPL